MSPNTVRDVYGLYTKLASVARDPEDFGATRRFTRNEIDQIWREATDRMLILLRLRAEQPEKYWRLIQQTDREWTYYWETTSLHAVMK